MTFNNLALNLFNESSAYFNLLVYEQDKKNIYDSRKMNKIVGKVDDINYRVVTVEELPTKISSHYKINYNNRIKGYFEPKDSLILIPKAKEQVKLTDELMFNSALNKYLKVDCSLYESINNKIAYSSSYAIFDDNLYEMIEFKGEIVGFFLSKSLEHLVKINQTFKINSDTAIYKDSSLNLEIKKLSKSPTQYKTEFFIPSRDILRFKYEGENVWLQIKSTDLRNIDDVYKPSDSSEALIQSVMFQYEDKLKKSHQYHVKILKQELKRLKDE